MESIGEIMNGMKAKKLRKDHANRFTEDGLPRDANEWTRQDWQDLHEAMKSVKEKIADRHKQQEDTTK